MDSVCLALVAAGVSHCHFNMPRVTTGSCLGHAVSRVCLEGVNFGGEAGLGSTLGSGCMTDCGLGATLGAGSVTGWPRVVPGSTGGLCTLEAAADRLVGGEVVFGSVRSGAIR